MKEFNALIAREKAGGEADGRLESGCEVTPCEMKVMMDTNVLVSGLICGGTPSRMLSALAHGEVSTFLRSDSTCAPTHAHARLLAHGCTIRALGWTS